jgi:hypothetical protein
MNMATILATYGVLTMIFQYGWGDEFLGFTSLGGLGMFGPATLFAILFALSTDYEVFVLSRVKEYYHALHDNNEAVARGLQNTAGVVTAAGLILVGTFGSFATASVVAIKEIGIGLAVGVLLDTTIVRVVMVPATMTLMGAANWWMPAWLKRIVPELREGAIPEPAPAPAAAVPAFAEETLVAQPELVRYLRPLRGSVDGNDMLVLRTEPLRVGRDESNDLRFMDDSVSRFHARIEFDPLSGTHTIVDLNSTNGVYVNGQRVAPQPAITPLRQGDQIELGGSGNVVLVYEARPVSSAGSAGQPIGVRAPLT